MTLKLLNYFKFNHKIIIRDTLLLIIFFIIGYILATSMKIDVNIISKKSLNPFSIFYHNIKIAFFSVICTFIFGYFIFVINSIFLGMSIYYASTVYTVSEMLKLFSFHGFLELLCWVLTLQISITFTKFLFQKKEKPSLKAITLILSLYFIAALIESYISG